MTKYIKTSEIGKRAMVAYRAKMLGITPISTIKGENIYSIDDADKILAYKPNIKFHSIIYFYILEEILKNDKFRYNPPSAAKFFKLKETKIQNMIDEYNKSGCFITASKMNNTEFD